MPTENERKFVLNVDLENAFRDHCQKIRHIRQGYLAFSKGLSIRVRDTNSDRFELTFKQKVKNRVIEIEKKIDQRDFEDLWATCINKLEKIRYDCVFEGKLWEVDAFKVLNSHLDVTNATYFLMAEHEMPEGQESPENIPYLIEKSLIYAVPLTDERFASKRIADINYAKKLYKGLLE